MKTNKIISAASVAACVLAPLLATAREYFVATNGCDGADGSAEKPWRTIGRAALVAAAGDVVTIRGGTYREWVKPANAGREGAPIVYRAAKGEKVVVTGADPVGNGERGLGNGWEKRPDGLWETLVAYDTFGGLNPFTDFITGRWFERKGRDHFRTRLIQDGQPLKLLGIEVFHDMNGVPKLEKGSAALIPGRGASGRIVAAFARDPNESVPELVVRPACFYPVLQRRDYITLRGLSFVNAGPDWAYPRAEQVGVVGTNWSRGWTVEDCEIAGSSCAGLTLGICANDFDSFWRDPKQRFYLWAKRMSERDWKDVGHHVVRRCRITDCGQAGICGAYGGAFSTIEDCDISYCYWKKPYFGQEMGCIKLHAAIDVTIARCRLHHSGTFGIWLDWMAQGTRITGNRLWANGAFDIYLEVNHGPILIEGNDMLSNMACWSATQGAAFVGNRIRGGYRKGGDEARRTPVFKPHSVVPDSLDKYSCEHGAFVYVNNILGGNPRFKNEVHPSRYEDNWSIPAKYWSVDDATGECRITPPEGSKAPDFKPVDAKRLGKPPFVDQAFPEPTFCKPQLEGTIQ